MRGKRWLKRLLVGLLFLVVIIVVLGMTYMYWLPYAVRPIAKRVGVTFSDYERLEGGRFALTEVVRTNEFFDLRISRVEGFLPHVWRSKLNETNVSPAYLEVNGWKVLVHDRPKGEGNAGRAKRERSVFEEWQRVERYITQARELLPKATLLNGTVQYHDKEYTLSVVTWENGVLDGTGVWPETAVPFDVKGRLTGEGPYQLSYAMTPLDLRARLRVVETNDLLNAQLATFYKENRADLNANFGTEGVLPVTATLKAPDFKLPGEMLKLEKYSEVTGSLAGEWKTNEYTIDLEAHAEPLESATNAPPADIAIEARGDTNSVRIERAVSTVPGLQLDVAEPLEVSYRGKMLSERSEVRINAELEKLPWLQLKGHVEGTILLERSEELPKGTFQASGTNLSALDIQVETLGLEGQFDWPRVDGFKADVRFANHSILTISGGVDLEERTLSETIVKAEGAFPTNLLAGQFHVGETRIEATISGPLSNLQHRGEIELRDFMAPQLQPLAIEAAWKARAITFEDLAVQAQAGGARIFASGSGYAGGRRTNFVVRELRLTRGDAPYLQLSQPARVTVTTNFQVELEPMVLVGTNAGERVLHVSAGARWPETMLLETRATNVNPSLFQPFFVRSLGGIDLERLNVTAGWSNSPVTGQVGGKFSVQDENFERLTADLNLHLTTNGLTVDNLSVLNEGSEICTARGFVPLTIHPHQMAKIRVNEGAEIVFHAASVPNQAFWETVSRLTHLRLSNAFVRLDVRGTTREPTGELHVKADGLKYLASTSTNRNWPEVGAFEGTVTLNQQVLRVPEFSFRISDQPVTLSGRLPLEDNFWSQRREEIVEYAMEHAELKVMAPEVKLAAFTEYLPKHLRAEGRLSVSVAMHEGRNFEGVIRVRDVETRPLPRIGVVTEIEADLALRGKEVHFENVSGVLGGERLSLGGWVDLSAESVAKGYPNLDLSVAGYNVPLARNPDVILRSDLKLRVTNGVNRIPVISGTATLRDSFLLRDITTLVPGRVARPERRPPYFSISQDPIDEWLLDVRVRGENFIRVRSPFFQGIASANFHITGTMVEPMALGEASVSSGNVIFPFATLAVRQALASLTSENPYLPHIFVVARGRAFGFDVSMEAEGPADDPIIQFSSVPALTSEQIVLMLTTGQIPRTDFGFSTQDRAGRLAFFLGKSLWAKLNPGQPAQERLTIRSGEDVTEQGRQTYEVEYKLNDRWSLVGEYNRFGDLNGNIKWRVFSR